MTVHDRLSAAPSGRYRIARELDAGGMATVYLAEDVQHDRKVAIKVLKPQLAAWMKRCGSRVKSPTRSTTRTSMNNSPLRSRDARPSHRHGSGFTMLVDSPLGRGVVVRSFDGSPLGFFAAAAGASIGSCVLPDNSGVLTYAFPIFVDDGRVLASTSCNAMIGRSGWDASTCAVASRRT